MLQSEYEQQETHDRIIQRGSCRIVRCSGGGSPPSSAATPEPLVALLHGSVAPLPRRRRAASLPGALAQLSSLSLESPLQKKGWLVRSCFLFLQHDQQKKSILRHSEFDPNAFEMHAWSSIKFFRYIIYFETTYTFELVLVVQCLNQTMIITINPYITIIIARVLSCVPPMYMVRKLQCLQF